MKKIFFLFLMTLGFWFSAFSQGVGIGTSSPSVSAILELKSSTKGLIFPRTSTTTRLSIAGAKGLVVYDTTATQFFYHTGGIWKALDTWGTNGTHIYSSNSGNVGIGNYLPAYKLSVNGDIYLNNTNPTIRLGGSSSQAKVSWELESNTTDFNITQFLNQLYISRTTGFTGFVNDLVVADNGYIGIGTSYPETRLNVVGGTDVGIASGGFIQLGAANALNIGFDNNEIQARNNGVVARLHLNNGGGTVQIGNAIAPASYSLAVNGKIICEELKVQPSSQWADYVFAEDYSLRSYDELREFIRTHHHLPNIPDAESIKKDGIKVGDMQIRMMEKI
ncbi:MAG: hypothetical protein ABIQ02_04085, partial [Saprospiraceae bacterium]